MTMAIGGLAHAGAVGVETVRYYQRRGLLAEPGQHGESGFRGVRRYDDGDVRKLRFIRSAQAAGFTLAEIGDLLAFNLVDDRARVRKLARDRAAALDAKIAALSAARLALHGLAVMCERESEGPCPILGAFDFIERPYTRKP